MLMSYFVYLQNHFGLKFLINYCSFTFIKRAFFAEIKFILITWIIFRFTIVNSKQMGTYSCFFEDEKMQRGTFNIKGQY